MIFQSWSLSNTLSIQLRISIDKAAEVMNIRHTLQTVFIQWSAQMGNKVITYTSPNFLNTQFVLDEFGFEPNGF